MRRFRADDTAPVSYRWDRRRTARARRSVRVDERVRVGGDGRRAVVADAGRDDEAHPAADAHVDLVDLTLGEEHESPGGRIRAVRQEDVVHLAAGERLDRVRALARDEPDRVHALARVLDEHDALVGGVAFHEGVRDLSDAAVDGGEQRDDVHDTADAPEQLSADAPVRDESEEDDASDDEDDREELCGDLDVARVLRESRPADDRVDELERPADEHPEHVQRQDERRDEYHPGDETALERVRDSHTVSQRAGV